MSTFTHILAVVVAAISGFFLTPAGQALVSQYPKLHIVVSALAIIAALYHVPTAAKPPAA